IVVLPLTLYFALHPSDMTKRVNQESVFSTDDPMPRLLHNIGATAMMLQFEGDPGWRHNIPNDPMLPVLVSIVFIVGLALSVYRREVWLVSMLVLGLVPAMFAKEVPHALHAILAIVPTYIIAAGGIWWGLDFLRLKATHVAAATGVVLLVV